MAMLAQQFPAAPAIHRASDAKTAVIVGAGPAGVAAAACLARRSWRCEVFERREEPVAGQNARGYPMNLNTRTMRTIQLAGLDVASVIDPKRPRRSLYFNGKPQPDPNPSKDPAMNLYLVDRVQFNKELYVAAAAQDYAPYGGSIRWHWGQQLERMDLTARVAVFTPSEAPSPGHSGSATPASTSSIAAEYDLLIGADGYNSAVRKELLAAVPSIKAESVVEALVTYKTFHELQITPALEKAIPGIGTQSHGHSILAYLSQNNPDLPIMAIWKQEDGSMSGMITGVDTWKADHLQTKLDRMVALHPELAPWVPTIIQQTSEGSSNQRPASFSKIVKLSQFHGPSCVLLGDSAHPVTSNLGSGCNMALESVRVFINTLDSAGLEAAPAAFTKARLPDVHAYQSLEYQMLLMTSTAEAVIHGNVRKPKPLEKLSSMLLIMGSAIPCMILHTLLPSVFKSPSFLTAQISNADVPYSAVCRSLYLNAGLTLAVLTAVVVAMVKVVAQLLRVGGVA